MNIPLIPLPQKIKYINGESVINQNVGYNFSLNPDIPESGYNLIISNNTVLIEYGDEQGRFYAQKTLDQIKAINGGKCSNLEIKDWPLMKHRGFMIDCARHFFTVEELKVLIDFAAGIKLNVFHWHLTDDQGWRIPIKSHPLLCEIGSKRKTSNFGSFDEKTEYCYCYTEEDIKDIIDYCKERFIEVIPEIDMPGHTSSILAAYPNLGCRDEKYEVKTKEGIFETVLCLGNTETKPFIQDILDEICDLFPGKYIHIGGDETPRTRWKECPKCREKLKEYNTDDIEKLQGFFMQEIAEYLNEKGKTAIAWNESLKGDILKPGQIIIQHWLDSKKTGFDFANRGGTIINSDFYHYYLDYPYGMTPVKKTYNYKPLLKIKNPDSLLGIEANLWTEYIRDFSGICQKLFPRICAAAETAWTDPDNKNYKDFVARHEELRCYFESKGISIIPLNQWQMPPLQRLADILKFFKGSISSFVFPDKND